MRHDGELIEARLTLSFDVAVSLPLRTFLGDVFTPDRITLTYVQESIGEDCWMLEEVTISGLDGPSPIRHSVGCAWKDAIARLPAWAWGFAAKVDPFKELGLRQE